MIINVRVVITIIIVLLLLLLLRLQFIIRILTFMIVNDKGMNNGCRTIMIVNVIILI